MEEMERAGEMSGGTGRTRAERIRAGKMSCGRTLERKSSGTRDLPARIAVACGIFLLLFCVGRFGGVSEEKYAREWVQENNFYERLVETAAQAVRERINSFRG